MNPAPLLLLLGLAFGVSNVDATAAALRVPPRDYQRLDEWARDHDFTVARAPGSRDVLVAGGSTRIELQVDSSRIEVNRVGVWLSSPVTATDQHVYVAAQDIRGVLEALFSPRRLPPGKRVRVVCLDAGHGGKDPGHRSGNRLEKHYTLLLAEAVRERLVTAGFSVVLTRRDDSYPELPERAEFARRQGADLFVSLHFNATPDGGSDASGIEVYAMTPEGFRSTNHSNDIGSLRAGAGNEFDSENLHLAFQIQKAILRNLSGVEDRGVRRARFVVLRLAEMPAVVVEGGFMSNPSDARWIYSLTGRRRMAEAIADGISAYRRLVERPALVSAPRTPERATDRISKPAAGVVAAPNPAVRARVEEPARKPPVPTAKPVPVIELPPPEPGPVEQSTPPKESLPPPTAPGTAPTPSPTPPPAPSPTNSIVFQLPPQRSTNSKSSSNTAPPESPKN